MCTFNKPDRIVRSIAYVLALSFVLISCGSERSQLRDSATTTNPSVQSGAADALRSLVTAFVVGDRDTALGYLPPGCTLNDKAMDYWMRYAIPLTDQAGATLRFEDLQLGTSEDERGDVVGSVTYARTDTSPTSPTTLAASPTSHSYLASTKLTLHKGPDGKWRLKDCPPIPPQLRG